MIETNWPKIRNACRKRLKNWSIITGNNLDDATQDACAFIVQSLAKYDDPESAMGSGLTRESFIGIEIYRSVYRVKRGQSPLWEAGYLSRWEREPDYTRAHTLPISDNPELMRVNWFEVENGIPA